jgi:hypothetical protein
VPPPWPAERARAACLLPLQGLGRKLRIALGFLYGWMGLPLPRKHPLYMATGRAVPVPKVRAHCPRPWTWTWQRLHAAAAELLLLLAPPWNRRSAGRLHPFPRSPSGAAPLLHHHHAPQGHPSDPDFEAKVDATHALVVEELQALYDKHKEEFGWKDRPLSIE